MQIVGIDNVKDATLILAPGEASADIVTLTEGHERYVNKLIGIISGGSSFVGVVTGADVTTNDAILHCTSLVNLALQEPYRDSTTETYHATSTLDNGTITAYKGIRHAAIDYATGAIPDEWAYNFVRRVVSALSSGVAARYGTGIDCRLMGGMPELKVQALEWNGDTGASLIQGLLQQDLDTVSWIDGTTLCVQRVERGNVKALPATAIEGMTYSFNLFDTFSRVVTEGPDIVGNEKAATNWSDSYQVQAAHPLLHTQYCSTSVPDVESLTSDERFNCFRYTGADNGVTIRYAYDARYATEEGPNGSAFERFGWQHSQAVIDDELGRCGATGGAYLTATWDRTSEQQQITQRYQECLRDVAYRGGVELDVDYPIQIGDWVQLPGMVNGTMVVGITHSLKSRTKAVALDVVAAMYNAARVLQTLSEIKNTEKPTERRTAPQPMVQLLNNITGEMRTMSAAQWRAMVLAAPYRLREWTVFYPGVHGKRLPKSSWDAKTRYPWQKGNPDNVGGTPVPSEGHTNEGS